MQFENHQYYNCKIELDNGEQYNVDANWLHIMNLDHWQGWQCLAGSKRLSIEHNFNVYSASCGNDFLGNALTGWELLTGATVCKKSRCSGCIDDILTEKQKI